MHHSFFFVINSLNLEIKGVASARQDAFLENYSYLRARVKLIGEISSYNTDLL